MDWIQPTGMENFVVKKKKKGIRFDGLEWRILLKKYLKKE